MSTNPPIAARMPSAIWKTFFIRSRFPIFVSLRSTSSAPTRPRPIRWDGRAGGRRSTRAAPLSPAACARTARSMCGTVFRRARAASSEVRRLNAQLLGLLAGEVFVVLAHQSDVVREQRALAGDGVDLVGLLRELLRRAAAGQQTRRADDQDEPHSAVVTASRESYAPGSNPALLQPRGAAADTGRMAAPPTSTSAARTGVVGTIVAAVAFFDGVFIGAPIALLAASFRPSLVYILADGRRRPPRRRLLSLGRPTLGRLVLGQRHTDRRAAREDAGEPA